MQFWKSAQYRMSLIRRGKIEAVTVARSMFFAVKAVFLTGILSLLYSSLGQPLMAIWRRIIQTLTQAGV